MIYRFELTITLTSGVTFNRSIQKFEYTYGGFSYVTFFDGQKFTYPHSEIKSINIQSK